MVKVRAGVIVKIALVTAFAIVKKKIVQNKNVTTRKSMRKASIYAEWFFVEI